MGEFLFVEPTASPKLLNHSTRRWAELFPVWFIFSLGAWIETVPSA